MELGELADDEGVVKAGRGVEVVGGAIGQFA